MNMFDICFLGGLFTWNNPLWYISTFVVVLNNTSILTFAQYCVTVLKKIVWRAKTYPTRHLYVWHAYVMQEREFGANRLWNCVR